jgi:hypothetical protein
MIWLKGEQLICSGVGLTVPQSAVMQSRLVKWQKQRITTTPLPLLSYALSLLLVQLDYRHGRDEHVLADLQQEPMLGLLDLHACCSSHTQRHCPSCGRSTDNNCWHQVRTRYLEHGSCPAQAWMNSNS